MAGSSDHQVELNRACYENGPDRISSLPDEVLTYILSLIPTALSVRTSVLSSRWKSLWASVPTLVFFYRYWEANVIKLKETNFIDKVIFSHNFPSIQRFCVKVRASEITRLNAWIEVIVRRGVQKIVLSTLWDAYASELLSRDLFMCKTLVELDLWNLELDIPDSVYLPCLKVFRITLRHPSNELTTRLFCSCSVLEQLYIQGNLSQEKRVFDISSPVLKTLELTFESVASVKVEHIVMINAPSLEDLIVHINCTTHFILKTSSPELRAKLSSIRSHPDLGDNLLGLLKEIFFVKHLCLSIAATAALKFPPPDYWPVFPNLTKLELDVFCNTDCRLLSVMLHSMPNLATLMLLFLGHDYGIEMNQGGENTGSNLKAQSVPICLQSCLVEVAVKGIKGCPSELKLIKYFLEDANSLTRVTLLHMMEDAVEIDKFLEKLGQLSWLSKTCQVKWGKYLGNRLIKV